VYIYIYIFRRHVSDTFYRIYTKLRGYGPKRLLCSGIDGFSFFCPLFRPDTTFIENVPTSPRQDVEHGKPFSGKILDETRKRRRQVQRSVRTATKRKGGGSVVVVVVVVKAVPETNAEREEEMRTGWKKKRQKTGLNESRRVNRTGGGGTPRAHHAPRHNPRPIAMRFGQGRGGGDTLHVLIRIPDIATHTY